MKKNAMRAALVAGVAVMAAGLPAMTAQASSAEAGSGATTSREKGHVLSCQGRAGDRSILVDLYDNSQYGSFASVNIEGPDGEYGGGSEPAQLFVNGSVSADVPIEHFGENGGDAGTATIRGTYALTGETTRIHDVYREPTWVVVTHGVHRQLSSSLTVDVLGETSSLSCQPSFEYDLKVTRTPM
ncbi:hypothetical protein [Streptomyces sp. NPDC020996]|uniref:hypothetical protein n=1 Tax=Streptomyces sp. NPDC020996 TaxID=3154791 RepID=UPI0033C23C55